MTDPTPIRPQDDDRFGAARAALASALAELEAAAVDEPPAIRTTVGVVRNAEELLTLMVETFADDFRAQLDAAAP